LQKGRAIGVKVYLMSDTSVPYVGPSTFGGGTLGVSE